jgi:hypothetical protein
MIDVFSTLTCLFSFLLYPTGVIVFIMQSGNEVPFTLTHVAYTDMHVVYGFCNGDGRAVLVE